MSAMTDGKKKHMKSLANARGVIAAAAMDQRGSLQKSLAKEKGVGEKDITPAMMSEFKTLVSKVLTPHAIAILLDPEFGLPAVKARAKGCGVLLSYEETGYEQNEPGRIPRLIRGWTARQTIDAGGNAVKLLIYYHPDDDKNVNALKHAFVERIGAECECRQIPFFLEFVGYDPKGGDEKGPSFAEHKPEVVRKSVAEFSKPHYHVDVLKIEVPFNQAYVEGSRAFKGPAVHKKSQAIDFLKRCDEAAKKPYIFLSAGVSDEVFRESLELAIESGVKWNGVLCGRATWKEGIPVYAKQGANAFEAWLSDRGVKNITALNKLLEKAVSWEAR